MKQVLPQLPLAVLFILLFTLPTAKEGYSAEISYDFIELGVVDLNPDYSPFENGHGFSLMASKTLLSSLFIEGQYIKAKIKVGGDLQSRELTDWWHLGTFLKTDLSSKLHLIGGVALQGTHLAGQNESGFSLQVGFRSLPFKRLEFNMRVGYLDLFIKDLQTIIEANYHLTDNFSIALRIRDYADWDYSSYEGGIRYNF